MEILLNSAFIEQKKTKKINGFLSMIITEIKLKRYTTSPTEAQIKKLINMNLILKIIGSKRLFI
jgi:hypothetical protein